MPLACLALALLTGGCEREQRDYRPKPALAALTRTISMSDIRPGGGPPPPTVHNAYEQNAYRGLGRTSSCSANTTATAVTPMAAAAWGRR